MLDDRDVLAIHTDLDAEADALVAEVADLARTPVISAQGIGVAEGVSAVAELMEACGLRPSVRQTAGNPVVLGTRIDDPSAPTVLVYGHYDVQPAEPLDAWTSPPFDPVVRDGRLFGRGVSDNKAQHFAQLAGLRAILRRHDTLPCNVTMLIEGEEEVGSRNLAAFVESTKDDLRADLAYTSDGGMHPSGRPVVLCGARGLLYLDVTLRRGASDLHSGSFGGVAPSAARELAAALASMWDDDGNVVIEGFFDGVRETSEPERRAVAALPVDRIAMSHVLGGDPEPHVVETWFERLLLRPNLNIAGFTAGWSGTGMKTIIPGEAVAKLDVRMVADQRADVVAAAVRRHLQARAPGVEVSVVGAMEPSRTPIDHPYVAVVAAAVAEGWGAEPLISPSLAGSVPDYVFTRILGLPSLIVPYANADQANHAPNENILVENVTRGAKTFVSVLAALGRHALART